jgi:septum site-determining protein MinD
MIIAVHSYKGGTGKTLLSTNLAATFAKQGKNVCLIDLDFRAPSIFSIFKAKNAASWFNDYLDNGCEVSEALTDQSSRTPGTGKLYVGFANPSTEAIRDMSGKDRGWEMKALERLLALRRTLIDTRTFDFIIFDTSPGLQYSSINAIVAANLVIVTTTGDGSDVEGTRRMLTGLYKVFGKKTAIVVNKILSETFCAASWNGYFAKSKEFHPSVLGILPCFCDILKNEGKSLYAIENPNHPFTVMLDEIAAKIVSLIHDLPNKREAAENQEILC